jgi:hypothetical protein
MKTYTEHNLYIPIEIVVCTKFSQIRVKPERHYMNIYLGLEFGPNQSDSLGLKAPRFSKFSS